MLYLFVLKISCVIKELWSSKLSVFYTLFMSFSIPKLSKILKQKKYPYLLNQCETVHGSHKKGAKTLPELDVADSLSLTDQRLNWDWLESPMLS